MADPKDAAKHQKIPSESSTRTQKQRRQQKYRRSNTLVQKAYELSTMADVDVFLGIRDRKTGRIKTFCADDKTGFWSSRIEHLKNYYPIPEQKTPADFSSKKKSKRATSLTTTEDVPEDSLPELRSESSVEPSEISNMD